MKKLILILFTLTFFYSCKKDKEETTPNNDIINRGLVTFKIDGKNKSFSIANSYNNGLLSMGDSENELITFFFPEPTIFPTTYSMNTEDMIIAGYIINNKQYSATNGLLGLGQLGSLTISITKYKDLKISGTFEFTGINENNEEVAITDGIFTDIPGL